MLPKKSRVNKELFEIIMKNGRVISGQFFTFRYLGLGFERTVLKRVSPRTVLYNSEVHLACVAPKNIAKSAVKRNYLRRKAYRALSILPIREIAKYGVFFYKKQGILASFEEIKEDMETLLKKGEFI